MNGGVSPSQHIPQMSLAYSLNWLTVIFNLVTYELNKVRRKKKLCLWHCAFHQRVPHTRVRRPDCVIGEILITTSSSYFSCSPLRISMDYFTLSSSFLPRLTGIFLPLFCFALGQTAQDSFQLAMLLPGPLKRCGYRFVFTDAIALRYLVSLLKLKILLTAVSTILAQGESLVR